MFDAEVQEEKRKKKKELQEKYLEKMKTNQKKKKSSSSSKIDWKAQYEEEKKKRKEIQKKLTQQEKQKERFLEKQREWHESLVKEQKKSQQRLRSLQDATSQVDYLQNQITEVKKERDYYEEVYQSLLTKQEIKRTKDRTNTSSKTSKVNQELRTKNEELRQQIRQLQYKLKINHTLRKEEGEDLYKQEIRSLRDRNRELMDKVKVYQDVQQPEHLLKVLRDLITAENLPHFFENKQNRLHPLMEKVVRIQEEEKRKKEHMRRLRLNRPASEMDEANIKLGFISKHKSVWYFFDTSATEEDTYEVYEVIGNVSNHKFQQDLPVKCILRDDEKATVLDVYKNHELPEPITRMFKPKVKEERKEKKEYAYFGACKVLIVGSRNLSDYEQRLTKHGLKVETHNPFEENYHRLDGKFQSADIVVVCTSHISHAVLNHIDKKHPKVELIERDNEEWIAARVRFSMHKLNLIPLDSIAHSS